MLSSTPATNSYTTLGRLRRQIVQRRRVASGWSTKTDVAAVAFYEFTASEGVRGGNLAGFRPGFTARKAHAKFRFDAKLLGFSIIRNAEPVAQARKNPGIARFGFQLICVRRLVSAARRSSWRGRRRPAAPRGCGACGRAELESLDPVDDVLGLVGRRLRCRRSFRRLPVSPCRPKPISTKPISTRLDEKASAGTISTSQFGRPVASARSEVDLSASVVDSLASCTASASRRPWHSRPWPD